ncbi:echinoderm microtubule-associated protein-like 1 [Hippocampus comes]|uniref:echinoderm microtubule-associated protein-like 1 n=1 Tax=Hippocampus comes TaxID=109280 RepID=UPI00094E1AD3|nr:PREDICTED: echinoderm microtubule-associated protein-like 1 [Hippocampus comes]
MDAERCFTVFVFSHPRLSLAVHPDKITIATGQVAGTSLEGKLAPHIRVWDSVSLNTLHVLGAAYFERALVCLAFSKSNGGNTLCVVDDSNDHVLSVWDWQREDRLAEVKVGCMRMCMHPSVAKYGPQAAYGSRTSLFWPLGAFTLSKDL